MRKYFFDKTNIRNILAITGLLFAILTFLMFFVTGSKGWLTTEYETSSIQLIFSASLFSLVIGKGFGFNYPEYKLGDYANIFKPGQNIVLIVAFTLACVVLLLAITIVIGMLYKKFNRKVLLGLSITEIVLLVVVAGLLIVSRAFIYDSLVNKAMIEMTGSTYEDIVEYFNSMALKVQPAIGTVLGSTFGLLGAGSGLAAVIFTRYSISNRQ